MQRLSFTNAALSMIQARPNLRQRGPLRVFRELLETVVLMVTIYALVNLASARFIVEGNSMLPNFRTGQYLIVSRVNYLLGEPERGDIIVFHYPRDPQNDYIKRVIGIPGDTVELRAQRVFVNGIELDEPYINEPCSPLHCPDRTWRIEPDTYFVMGDNRNESSDSRSFGAVERRFLVGEAVFRYWPPEDWGVIHRLRTPEVSTVE